MMILVLVVHVIVCVGLIIVVLIQRGRGGGLVESFSGMESMFGTKTSAMLTKATTVMSVCFFVTCLLLAVMSVHQSKSLMRRGLRVQPIASGTAGTQTAASGTAAADTSAAAQTAAAAPAVPAAATETAQAQ